MIYFLAVVLCVVLDQGVKLWTVGNLALHESAPLLPGIVELYYIQNTGGGFSILTGHTWLLTVVTAVLLTGFAVLLIKKVFTHPLAVWTLVLVIGGGIGNLIDRVRLGYVVDMFHFEFWPSYPVFNVADICVVCGAVLGCIYYLWLYEKYDMKPKKGETDGTSDAPTE